MGGTYYYERACFGTVLAPSTLVRSRSCQHTVAIHHSLMSPHHSLLPATTLPSHCHHTTTVLPSHSHRPAITLTSHWQDMNEYNCYLQSLFDLYIYSYGLTNSCLPLNRHSPAIVQTFVCYPGRHLSTHCADIYQLLCRHLPAIVQTLTCLLWCIHLPLSNAFNYFYSKYCEQSNNSVSMEK